VELDRLLDHRVLEAVLLPNVVDAAEDP